MSIGLWRADVICFCHALVRVVSLNNFVDLAVCFGEEIITRIIPSYHVIWREDQPDTGVIPQLLWVCNVTVH